METVQLFKSIQNLDDFLPFDRSYISFSYHRMLVHGQAEKVRKMNILKIWTVRAEGMMFRVFILLIGFGFSVSGGVTLIMYLNLLAAGLSFQDYFLFILGRVESYLLLTGIFLITISIYSPARKS
jgi:hypothetical protein